MTVWKEVPWGALEPQDAPRLSRGPDRPSRLARRGSSAQPRRHRQADRPVVLRLEVDPVDRARRDVVAQIEQRDRPDRPRRRSPRPRRRTPGSGAATPPPHRVPRPGPRRRGGRTGEGRRPGPRGAAPPGPASLAQHDLGELHRAVRRVVGVHPGQEQIVRAQVDDHDVDRMVGGQGDGQVRQPVAVRLERHVEHGGATALALPRSRGRRRRARAAGRPATDPSAPGARPSRPRSPRCSSRRSRGRRSRYSGDVDPLDRRRRRRACPARRPAVFAIASTTS